MSKKRNNQEHEPKIHLVNSDLKRDVGLPIEIEVDDTEEDYLQDYLDETREEIIHGPSWETVKDSIVFLEAAWFHVNGSKLLQSDLYKMMHTSEHRKVVDRYLLSLDL